MGTIVGSFARESCPLRSRTYPGFSPTFDYEKLIDLSIFALSLFTMDPLDRGRAYFFGTALFFLRIFELRGSYT